MDSTFGLVGKDFAIIASDAAVARSILVFKHDVDKIVELDSHKIMVGAGVAADNASFSEYIQKNMKLYELNNDVQLDTDAAAAFIRNELARALRKGPYQTNLLIAGYDKNDDKVSLHWIDYMASHAKVPFGAHGYAGNFVISIFDREWKHNMTLEQGFDIIRMCLHELKTRFMISQPVFVIKVVDKNGIRRVEL
jgi:20S proteasome subunit beta 4